MHDRLHRVEPNRHAVVKGGAGWRDDAIVSVGLDPHGRKERLGRRRVGRYVVDLPRHDGSHGDLRRSDTDREGGSLLGRGIRLPKRTRVRSLHHPDPHTCGGRPPPGTRPPAHPAADSRRRSCRPPALCPAAAEPATRSTAERLDRSTGPRRWSIACAPLASARRSPTSRLWPMRSTRSTPRPSRRRQRCAAFRARRRLSRRTRVGLITLPPSERGGPPGEAARWKAGRIEASDRMERHPTEPSTLTATLRANERSPLTQGPERPSRRSPWSLPRAVRSAPHAHSQAPQA